MSPSGPSTEAARRPESERPAGGRASEADGALAREGYPATARTFPPVPPAASRSASFLSVCSQVKDFSVRPK
jgi:hypothetical protein